MLRAPRTTGVAIYTPSIVSNIMGQVDLIPMPNNRYSAGTGINPRGIKGRRDSLRPHIGARAWAKSDDGSTIPLSPGRPT